MNRRLYLCSSPYQAFQAVCGTDVGSDCVVVTPGAKAARAIGFPHRSLVQFARKTLESKA